MIRLHSYWRSTAAYRVRIGLNLKGLAYEQVTHDLRIGAQASDTYASINPQKLIPSLEADGLVLTQSLPILEWLEETHPTTPLLPKAAGDRAVVRAMAAMVAADIHPINNLRVLAELRGRFAADEAQVGAWIAHWIGAGFAALETMIERHGGRFAFGDTPTLADCCLVPQVYSAERFSVDVTPYPRLTAAVSEGRALEAFAAAHPARQPDAD